MNHELIAEVWRGDLVESVHYGTVIALDARGEVALSAGEPHALMYPRSANKPLQATAMLESGLDIDGELLALACASHAGEPFHVDGVRTMLAKYGLTESDLRCTADLPLDESARNALIAAGITPAPLYMNCSGKHAAMLASCVAGGWPTETYRSPDHPLQQRIRHTIERLAGEDVGAVGVDGCGAALFGFSLHGLARAFRALATAADGSREHRVAEAMRTYPEWVDGTGRPGARLSRALPGAVAKGGAEGVFAVALPDGRALAMKVADGNKRAVMPVAVAALRAIGVDSPALADVADEPVLGHGERVGAVRAAPALTDRW
ncbi:MAG: asparaginase [Sciscionella sp.]|nr:asparaginase [Sciscionella sp.]